MTTFQSTETARLLSSGWEANALIRECVVRSGLPTIPEALEACMTARRWEQAELIADAMRQRFAGYRFAVETAIGLVMVPSPAHLDTRGRIPQPVRAGQRDDLSGDFVDPALGAGVDITNPNEPWTAVVTTAGRYGFSCGSYDTIVDADAGDYDVCGHDTRRAMVRQVWGARLLQTGSRPLPDSDLGPQWTFSLLPGEGLVAGQAVSATVLKGRVRFRLGKSDRGIGSARVSPAVPLP